MRECIICPFYSFAETADGVKRFCNLHGEDVFIGGERCKDFPKKSKIAPCTSCQQRHVGCHSDCVAYAVWKEAEDETKQKKNAAKRRENLLNGYTVKAKQSMQKHTNHRGKSK